MVRGVLLEGEVQRVGGAVVEVGAGEDAQAEEFDVVGVQAHDEVNALFESGEGVAGESVDEVKAKVDALFVQNADVLDELLFVHGAMDVCKHLFAGALESDLE